MLRKSNEEGADKFIFSCGTLRNYMIGNKEKWVCF